MSRVGKNLKATTMVGRKFGILTVVARAHRLVGSGNYAWLCRCECGVEKTISASNLRSGQQSCGCLARAKLAEITRRRHAAKVFCAQGHPYTAENVVVRVFKNGTRQRSCRICQRQKSHNDYLRHRALLRSLKPKCSACDETHPACLDFHHRDPSSKSFNLTTSGTRVVEKIMAEVAKCDVLCANCHRKLHYNEHHDRKAAS